MTLHDLPRSVPGFERVEFLVIDDGSHDRTVDVARDLGVHHVVSHSSNLGLAAAFMTGIETALRLGADVIVNTDADNQYVGADIPTLTSPIVQGRADLVIGERPIREISDFSMVKKRLQRLGTFVVRRLSKTNVQDAASGFRALNRECALRTRLHGRYSYTMETIIQAGWEGLRVQSVPIHVNSKTRESRLVRSVPQYILRSATTLVRSFALYKSFRFFFALAVIPLIFGAGTLTWSSVTQGDRAIGAGTRLEEVIGIASILIGFQLVFLAFVADLLAANRRILTDISLAQKKSLQRSIAQNDDGSLSSPHGAPSPDSKNKQ